MHLHELTDDRFDEILRGGTPTDEEMGGLLKLAQLGRQVAMAPEAVILSQGTSGSQGRTLHTWTVDVGFDEDPKVAKLLGQRVVVVAVEQVLRGYKRGSGWPKEPGDMRLMPGVRPPRGWVTI